MMHPIDLCGQSSQFWNAGVSRQGINRNWLLAGRTGSAQGSEITGEVGRQHVHALIALGPLLGSTELALNASQESLTLKEHLAPTPGQAEPWS